jgi:hypothetical protein
MKKIKLVSIGAIARSGKDSLAKSIFTLAAQDGYNCKIYSLANALKSACAEFLSKNFGYDVWTDNTDEKSKFRDFLVLFGKMYRENSKGTHWTSIVEKQIQEDATKICNGRPDFPFLAIVADIRYADPRFPEDEAWWVQNKMGGKLINLNRIDNGVMVPPANADEEFNSKRIFQVADYHLTWDTVKGELDFTNTFNGEIFAQVNPVYKTIKEQYLEC